MCAFGGHRRGPRAVAGVVHRSGGPGVSGGGGRRLETQERVNRGLSYRVFGEIAEPPDGTEDPALPAGVKVRDVLCSRLRITAAEVQRRMKVAARLRARRSLTGPPRPPELPVLAAAVAEGAVGEDHIRAVCKALDCCRARCRRRKGARRAGVGGACPGPGCAVRGEVGRVLADTLNPDGVFDERDRANRRGLVLGPQGPDGMASCGEGDPDGAGGVSRRSPPRCVPAITCPAVSRPSWTPRSDSARSRSGCMMRASGVGDRAGLGGVGYPSGVAGHGDRQDHAGGVGGGGAGGG